MYVTSRVCSS